MHKNLQASGQLPGPQNQLWSFCIPLYLHFHVTSHSRESGVGWRTFQACNWDPQSRAPSCPSFVQLYTPDVGHTPRKTPGAHSPKGRLLSQLLFFNFHHYWFCQCHCLNLGSNLKPHVGWKYTRPLFRGKMTHTYFHYSFSCTKPPQWFSFKIWNASKFSRHIQPAL